MARCFEYHSIRVSAPRRNQFVCKARVIQTKQMEDGCVQIVNVNTVAYDVKPQVISLTNCGSESLREHRDQRGWDLIFTASIKRPIQIAR